jgi:hypothetical protein
MIGEPREHVREPGVRIDVVELGSLDEGVAGGGAPAAFVGAGEGPEMRRDVRKMRATSPETTEGNDAASSRRKRR